MISLSSTTRIFRAGFSDGLVLINYISQSLP